MGRMDELEARIAAIEDRLPVTGPIVDPASDFALLESLEQRSPDTVMVVGSVALAEEGNVRWQYGRPHSVLTDQDWDDRAGRLAALGNPLRLRLLQAIHRGQHSTSALAELDGIESPGQVQHHLRVLSAAGWIEPVGRGRVAIPAARIVPLLAVLVATEH